MTQGGIGLGPKAFHLQDAAINRGSISFMMEDHLQRSLVGARRSDSAKVSPSLALSGQVIANQIKSGMRPRFVIDPGGSAQVREGFKIALPMNYYIREIYRAIAIPFAAQYRRSQQFDPGNRLIRLPDVGQTTNPADVYLPRIQQAFTFLPGDVVNKLRGYFQPLGNISGNLTADEVCILGHA